jgi:hypothetical protein
MRYMIDVKLIYIDGFAIQQVPDDRDLRGASVGGAVEGVRVGQVCPV